MSKIPNLTFFIPKNNVLSKQSKVKGTRMKYKQTQSQTAIDINKGQSKFGMCVYRSSGTVLKLVETSNLKASQCQKNGAKLIKMHNISFSKNGINGR